MLRLRRQLTEQAEPLGSDLSIQRCDTGRIAAGTIQALHQAEPDRVGAGGEHDRDRRGRLLRRHRGGRAAGRDDESDALANQLGRHARQQLVLAARPAIVDRSVLPLDKAAGRKPLAESREAFLVFLRRAGVQEADGRHRLRPRRQWQCGNRTGKRTEKLPAPHSITSSARSRKDSAIVRPSVLAVFRLTMRSNLTGACTGRSPGFSPLRIRST
jgi:hypothetical protein